MNRPKFEVGEEVILASRECPHLNGEYFVDLVIKNGDIYKDRVTSEITTIICGDETYGHLLSNIAKAPELNQEIVWDESALRKKHKPAEMSFSALMQSLTSSVGVQETAISIKN